MYVKIKSCVSFKVGTTFSYYKYVKESKLRKKYFINVKT